MNVLIILAVVAAGVAFWAYRHGKLAGAVTELRAFRDKIEGKTADPAAPVLPKPDPAIVSLQTQIAALAKKLGA